MPRQQQPAAVRDAIVTMYLDGLTVRQIATVSNLRLTMVDHVLQEENIRSVDRGKNLVAFWTEQYAKIL